MRTPEVERRVQEWRKGTRGSWPVTLAAGLEHEDLRPAARQALGGFLGKIVIPPGDELLRVVGNGGMIPTAARASGPAPWEVTAAL
jgi:hypothetical protein